MSGGQWLGSALCASFSTLTLLVGRQEGHLTCKKPVPLSSKGYLATQVEWRKNLGGGDSLTQDHLTNGYYKNSAVAEMGDHLATIDMGRKVGGASVAPFEGMGPHLTQVTVGRGLHPYQVTS